MQSDSWVIVTIACRRISQNSVFLTNQKSFRNSLKLEVFICKWKWGKGSQWIFKKSEYWCRPPLCAALQYQFIRCLDFRLQTLHIVNIYIYISIMYGTKIQVFLLKFPGNVCVCAHTFCKWLQAREMPQRQKIEIFSLDNFWQAPDYWTDGTDVSPSSFAVTINGGTFQSKVSASEEFSCLISIRILLRGWQLRAPPPSAALTLTLSSMAYCMVAIWNSQLRRVLFSRIHLETFSACLLSE